MLLRTPRDVGLALREQRRRIGLDQAALAERMGVSRKWVIEAERGSPGAGIGLVLRAFTVLGTPLALPASEADARAAPAVDVVDIDGIVDG